MPSPLKPWQLEQSVSNSSRPSLTFVSRVSGREAAVVAVPLPPDSAATTTALEGVAAGAASTGGGAQTAIAKPPHATAAASIRIRLTRRMGHLPPSLPRLF